MVGTKILPFFALLRAMLEVWDFQIIKTMVVDYAVVIVRVAYAVVAQGTQIFGYLEPACSNSS